MAEVWLNGRANQELLRASTIRTHDNIANSARRLPPHSPHPVRFAHPAETAIAALFDAFGIRWLYEPTTFRLITSQTGLPVQSFTPDFFLPDHDTYIEMTTMRQSLVTRKNRKFRLMRELYPEIDVRLLYRKDVELILHRPTTEPDETLAIIGGMVGSNDLISRKARDVATNLTDIQQGGFHLIALGEGATTFRNRIAANLSDQGREVRSSCVHIARSLTGARETAFAIERDPINVTASFRRVLVADVVSTGLTAHAATKWLASVELPIDQVVALLDRRSARLIDVSLAVPAIACPSAWVVGCGLGNGETALLPALHTIAG